MLNREECDFEYTVYRRTGNVNVKTKQKKKLINIVLLSIIKK